MTVTLKLNADTVRVGDAAKGTVSGGPPGATVTVELLWRTEGDCETDERSWCVRADTTPPAEIPLAVHAVLRQNPAE